MAKKEKVEEEIGFDIPDIIFGEKSEDPAYVVEPDAKKLAVKFGVIGSGQAGDRLADTFWKVGYRRVCAINTTKQDFLGLSIPEKNLLTIGSDVGGAGKDPEKGAQALRENVEEVLNLMRHSFGEDIDRIIVCSSAGGGTGSGCLPGLIRLAKTYLRQLGKEEKVGCVVSLPKKMEGGKVQQNAYKTVEHLETEKVSPLVIADNESINQMFPNTSAKEFWTIANQNIVGLFDIFNVLACQQSSYVTFDKADYESMLDSGMMIFGATKLTSYQKDTDISDGLRNNLKKTLLAEVDLHKASHVAAILCASDPILSILPQSDIDRAFSTLERMLDGESRNLVVHQGVYEIKKKEMFLYTMVGGLEIPKNRVEMMKARAGI